jgi:hypothetical protein
MILTSMRKGFVSFIFMALLFIGAFGLVLSDAGGFFRDGVGRTDVARIGSTKISAIAFDRVVTRNLRGQQMTPQDAYKTGVINELLNQEISKFVLAKEAENLGIVVSDATVAKEIKNFIDLSPIPTKDPKEALKMILQQQGISEKDFVAQLKQEVAAQLVLKSMTGAVELPPPPVLTTAIYNWFSMMRDIDVVDITIADEPMPVDPDQATLSAFYDDIKDEYAIAETRNVKMVVFSPKNFAGKSQDDIFNMINEIDERLIGGESPDQLKDEYQLSITPLNNLTAESKLENAAEMDKDPARLLQIIFESGEGETSPMTELSNGDMAAFHIEKINAASFKPLESVKAEVIIKWKDNTRANNAKAKAEKIIASVNKDKKSLKDAGGKTVTRFEGVSLNKPNTNFAALDVQKIMAAPLNEAILIPSSEKIQIVVGVNNVQSKTPPTSEDMDQISKALELDRQDEAQDQLILGLLKKYDVHINKPLLDRMYGASADTNAE